MPLVKLGSALIIHIVFLVFSTVVLNFSGYYASWYYVQIMYYLLSATIFALLLGMITASLAVYIRDVIQVVGIIIQIGFWACPICWGSDMQMGKIGMLLKANPMYYCVEGYRSSLIYRQGFWESPLYTLYYWCLMAALFCLAVYMYRKLRPGFADVM